MCRPFLLFRRDRKRKNHDLETGQTEGSYEGEGSRRSLYRFSQRQRNGEHRSGTTFIGGLDAAIVIKQNAIGDSKSETSAMLFGGEKRVEDLRQHFRRYSTTGIGYTDYHRPFFLRRDIDAYTDSPPVWHGITRVQYQVEEYLLELMSIAE